MAPIGVVTDDLAAKAHRPRDKLALPLTDRLRADTIITDLALLGLSPS